MAANASMVTEIELHKLAKICPVGKYYEFCLKLNGTGHNEADKILTKHLKDYEAALREVLVAWRNATGGPREDLQKAMRDSEIGGQIPEVFSTNVSSCSTDSTAGSNTKGLDKKELNELFIADLAKSIGNPSNLPDLGLKLGFQESQVNIYKKTNQRNEDWSGTRQMLFDWKRNTSKKDQIPRLKTALTESGFAELADQL